MVAAQVAAAHADVLRSVIGHGMWLPLIGLMAELALSVARWGRSPVFRSALLSAVMV